MATHETVEAEKAGKKLGDRLQCVVVTPERTLFDELVEFVALPLYDGELGVLPGRTPLIGRLGYGELRTRTPAAPSATSSTAGSPRSATTSSPS